MLVVLHIGIYLYLTNSKGRTSPLFAFNMQTSTEYSTISGIMFCQVFILLIKSDLKWCTYLSKSISLYLHVDSNHRTCAIIYRLSSIDTFQYVTLAQSRKYRVMFEVKSPEKITSSGKKDWSQQNSTCTTQNALYFIILEIIPMNSTVIIKARLAQLVEGKRKRSDSVLWQKPQKSSIT